MLKKPKPSQNNLQTGLFAEQAQSEYFRGHSSFALQLPAHFTASRSPPLQENRTLPTGSDVKENNLEKRKPLYQNLWRGI